MDEKKKLINWIGLTGILSLLSYAAAVVFAPLAYPGYDWLSQAVSDLSAESSPSRLLWDQLSALWGVCSAVCVTCVSIYISEHKTGSKLFRLGVYLFTAQNWVSKVGYQMFPLTDSGKEISTFQERMHMVITMIVVLLSILSLTLIIIASFKNKETKGVGIWAAVCLAMMFVGAIGKGIVPVDYFGVVERFSVFGAVGFTGILGLCLFTGFKPHIEAAQEA
ncbi:MAG: DUF998 domain-containing protein [Oscillospiraceae bacterium]|nr:DUF998 domain-containing protein [Oscillospiraceae bacterium]